MGGADTSGSGSAKSEPNVVPLCDILLVLLIIFMVVTPMLKKGVNVDLPEAINTSDQPEPGRMVMVYIKKDGAVWVEDQEVTDFDKFAVLIDEEMEEKQQQNEAKVLLQADADVSYGRVVEVMNKIRNNANIEEVGLITQKTSSK